MTFVTIYIYIFNFRLWVGLKTKNLIHSKRKGRGKDKTRSMRILDSLQLVKISHTDTKCICFAVCDCNPNSIEWRKSHAASFTSGITGLVPNRESRFPNHANSSTPNLHTTETWINILTYIYRIRTNLCAY